MGNAQVTFERPMYRPGAEVRGTLGMDLAGEINARSLVVRAVGEEHVKISTAGHGKRLFRIFTKLFDAPLRLLVSRAPQGYALGEGRRERFIPGTYQFRFAFRLPNELPASYYGISSDIGYFVEARVDVPWWRDVAARHEFIVLSRGGRHARHERKWTRWAPTTQVRRDYFIAMREGMAYQGDEAATVFESQHKEGETGFLAEVAKTVFEPGEVIAGYIILKNPQGKRLKRLDLELTWKEYACVSGTLSEFKRQSVRVEVPVPEEIGGNPFPFGIRVPHDALPTVAGSWSFYCWELKMTLKVHLGFDVSESIWLTVA